MSYACDDPYDDDEDDDCWDCGGEGVLDDECECQRVVDNCCCKYPTPMRCRTCKGSGRIT